MNPAILVPVREIVVDDRLQPRCDGLNEEHIAALMETPEEWPPIVIAQIDGSPILIDGFHRQEAARRLSLESLSASVFYPDRGTDLFSIAFSLNAKHGRPLSLRDRKGYAAWLVQQRPDLSDREIGKRACLHHETVGALRRGDRGTIGTYQRKPGALPTDVGLFDRIRFAKATRDQKAVAGYIQRVAISLSDPYEEGSDLESWPDDPIEIARACFITMGAERATKVLSQLEDDAKFILQVTKARTQLSKEVPT